ncbi:VWA containing CoxE family protein [Rhodococcus ruber BKS 20-38]|uniref:VWA containing CoxE family protein n=1 Tax=Rhodococcus ruber BKS 20-38 TaxID=1278076 RepID=M2XPD7_9NOCA|nr:VWA domain-containing protein [Rhodococcus ruber]EME62891.1 VWA containing CoxE family protein [Rhodococcus ruber BKS 20-38]
MPDVVRALEPMVAQLRATGIPVSTTQIVDSLRALQYIDVGDHRQVETALTATLVRDSTHLGVFSTLLSLYLHDLCSDRDGSVTQAAPSTTAIRHLDEEQLRGLLLTAMADDAWALVPRIAEELVDRHARIHPGLPVAGTLYVFRVLRALRVDEIEDFLCFDAEDVGPARLHRELRADSARLAVQRLQQTVETEVRKRLVQDRGAPAVAAAVGATLPDDIDFMTASTAELDQLHATLARMPDVLANRLRLSRSRRNGPVDLPTTVRSAMATAGVPLALHYRRRPPPQPRLFVLADISGSVASFARFTLLLLRALRSEFRAVRSFAFIDSIDEITDLVASARSALALARMLDERHSGIELDGHSDYGNVFTSFGRSWGRELTSTSIVIVIGDGRSNHRPSAAEELHRISRRAGRLYWLNPERQASWGDGDSLMVEYASSCDSVVECRNVRGLRAFVESLA